jgi:RimJ/RimL family protein N-acetyltransferase
VPINSVVGKFINLRPLVVEDAELTLAWRKAARARHLNAVNSSLSEQENWINSRPTSELNFIIEMKNSYPIGTISLIGIDLVNKHAETGRFLIGDEETAKGVPAAVEAMKLLYQLAFDQMDLVRIFGTIASGNVLMIKWQKYLGMKEEGRMRSHYFIDGKWQDAVVLGLLAEEARMQSIPRMNALIASARRHLS